MHYAYSIISGLHKCVLQIVFRMTCHQRVIMLCVVSGATMSTILVLHGRTIAELEDVSQSSTAQTLPHGACVYFVVCTVAQSAERILTSAFC